MVQNVLDKVKFRSENSFLVQSKLIWTRSNFQNRFGSIKGQYGVRHILKYCTKLLSEIFLSAMSRARASRDLNQLFCFVKLGCLLAFWFVCQNFGLFARIQTTTQRCVLPVSFPVDLLLP